MTTLLVCSSGGHLKQLHRLVPRLGLDDMIWITHKGALAKSLLATERVVYIEHFQPRQIIPILRAAPLINRVLSENRIVRVVSTGASPALAVFPLARPRRIPCHYIESATRSEGPSLTGKLCALIPGAHLYTQHESWANSKWLYRGSVFDGFSSRRIPDVSDIRSAVVTLGTSESHGFRRLLERLLSILPQEADVLWQTGTTDVSDLPITATERVPSHELEAAMRRVDVVIAHAGTGAAITALEAGKCPVLVPRRSRFGEHIDDHQILTATQMSNRNLAVSAEVEELSMEHLLKAASTTIDNNDHTPLFRLTQ